MKQIQRHLFILVCLLIGIGGYADNFKIIRLDKSGGDANCTLTAKMGSTDIDNSTEIPEGTLVTLTVSCGTNYSLKSLTYEEVTTIDQAEAPRRATPPPYVSVYDFNIEVNYPQYAVNHFAGDYTFYMPKNNIIVTATFEPLATFLDNSNITISLGDTPITYDGYAHSLVVKDGETQLRKGLDFQITGMTFDNTDTGGNYTIQNAGAYVVTIEGIGTYRDTKTSGTLTINYKALTITAQDQTNIQYPNSIATGIGKVTVSGLVTHDALTGITLTPSTTNATGSTPGTITPSAATTTNGISNYTVTYVEGSLVINPKPISTSATFTQSFTEVNYNATQQKPNITISDGATLLAEGTDYDITYTSHFFPSITPIDFSQPDIYYITITYKGNYSGSKSAEYQIRKQVLLSNDYRWITYYTPTYNIEVLTGFKAYAVSGLNTNAVELSEKNYIKAGKPMLLYRTGDGTSFYPPLVSEVEDWTASAKYKSNPADWNLDSDNNIQNGTTKIWILVRDYFVRTKSGTLAEGKCYLDLSGTTYFNAPLYINQTPTGINAPDSILNNLETGAWYTLDGCKLHGIPSKKGIYINNGKKIIIK